ncbi:MAG: methylmalonyl Co-A mutase-associated GTPase MeaB [Pseudomonadota bacterium]|nr:methylmalonyl Co-A mutase-associated GTPase MeaB [Pseudomonadota bacterium]
MKLKNFLKLYKIPHSKFSRNLGVTSVSLSRYINGDRLPEKRILKKIFELTNGLVDANDFYLDSEEESKITEEEKMVANEILENLRNFEKRYIAKAITLIESSLICDKVKSSYLLSEFKDNFESVRIGVTGVPGVGKSTFIEAFGMKLIDLGFKVAVLAIDPSSKRSGGSILGDKTRMMRLSVNKNAFIRPSPSQGHLGGVAKKTNESIRCLEEAGFDIIFVETMGVGQAETAVYDMVDIFLVLLLPSGGDELQGIKKGIIEIADLIIVNKADGNLEKSAILTKTEYNNAIKLISRTRKGITPDVLTCSSTECYGLDEIWDFIKKYTKICKKNGSFFQTRKLQKIKSLWNNVNLKINDFVNYDLRSKDFVKKIIKEVENNNFDVNNASKVIFDFLSKK